MPCFLKFVLVPVASCFATPSWYLMSTSSSRPVTFRLQERRARRRRPSAHCTCLMTSEESQEGKDGRNKTLFMRRGLARCVYGCGKETVMSSPCPDSLAERTYQLVSCVTYLSFSSLRFSFGRQIPNFVCRHPMA